MLGRLFGRSKEDNDETICATCGRTLLAGEWTQRLVDDDGRERYVCSLCSRPVEPVDEIGTPAPEVAAVGAGRVKAARADSDAFWRAIKDKDAEIERLESLLARSEAEKQELAAQLASLRARDGEAPDAALVGSAGEAPADLAPAQIAPADVAPADAAPADLAPADLAPADRAPDTAVPASQTDDDLAPAAWVDDVGQTMDVPPSAFAQARADDAGASETPSGEWGDVGSETVEIPPDELERVLAGDDADDDVPAASTPAPVASIEHTDPGLGQALRAAQVEAPLVDGFEDEAAAHDQGGFAAPDDTRFERDIVIVRPGESGADAPSAPSRSSGFEPLDDAVPLTVLQRGVDLLNVSAVPRRIVETNESLGMPQVHVGSQSDGVLLVTFMWTMGWYQFCVELADGGRITLAERGYDERIDLRPNASVRADGTVQLAPTQIKPPTPRDDDGVKPTGVTSGVIISKSMMGQRTDDENVPADWKTKRAPDFDWGR